MKELYVGLDLSTTNTGVFILDEHKKIVDYYLISPNKALSLDDRVLEILKALSKLYKKYSTGECRITHAAIESGALFGKGKRNELAMLNGVVYYSLLGKGIDTTLVPPSRLKKYATGNGRASKDDMFGAAPKVVQKKVSSEYKKYDDVIDAYHLACFCVDHSN